MENIGTPVKYYRNFLCFLGGETRKNDDPCHNRAQVVVGVAEIAKVAIHKNARRIVVSVFSFFRSAQK